MSVAPVPPVPSKSAEAIRKEVDVPDFSNVVMEPTKFPMFEVSIYTDIGGRKYQEDRFTFSPKLISNRNDCAFFGVFDGTVGDFASDTVKHLVVPHLVNSPGWRDLSDTLKSLPNDQTNGSASSSPSVPREVTEKITPFLADAINSMYKNSDEELVHQCGLHKKDYASSTSVTAVMAGGLLGVGHLGDSRIALGSIHNNAMVAEFLTTDHKPDQPTEKERIISCKGSVEYLHNHNNKPFIRGGDFTDRKSKGEQPMQLQYSRAFGGKDLKKFGLSNDPDVKIIHVDPSFKCMILASDGLWDVLAADGAVNLAMEAKEQRKNPAEHLVKSTLHEQRVRNQSADNITAMVVHFGSAMAPPAMVG